MHEDVAGASASRALPPEGELLLRTSLVDMTPADIDRARQIVRASEIQLDWGVFVHLAAKHRVLPLVARNFDRHTLGPIGETRHHLLRSSYLFSLMRSQAFARELRQIIARLDGRGVAAMVRKGAFLASEVYADPAIRYMVDIDLFVPEESIRAFTQVMQDLGYRQGRDSADRRTMEPLRREVAVFYQLHVAELPPFLRLTSDPYIDVFTVDVRKNMLERASGKSISASDLLKRASRRRLVGEPAWALGPEDMLLDLTLHLFREATTLATIQAGKDLCIYRFLDIHEYYKWALPSFDADRFLSLTREYGVEAEVYYALHFTNALYTGVIEHRLLDGLRPVDLAYLDEYGQLDGRKARWDHPFMQRLFDRNRDRAVKGETVLPRARGQRGDC
jgi:hypothetical protein